MSLVQTVSNSSSSGNPGSLALTYAATGAGNLLAIGVCAVGTSPTFGIPSNGGIPWEIPSINGVPLSYNDATMALGWFIYRNNPGGIVSATVPSIVTVSGGAACVGLEFSMAMGQNYLLDQFILAVMNGTTIPQAIPSQLQAGEALMVMIGGTAGAITPANSPSVSNLSKTSTGGAAQVSMNVLAAQLGAGGEPSPTMGGTGVSTHRILGMRFLASPMSKNQNGNSGAQGQNFFAGMAGGG